MRTIKGVMLDKVKDHLDIKKAGDFAEYLGIKASTLSSWYARNTFDHELLFAKCKFLNAEWILSNGKGEMLKQNAINETKESNKKKIALFDEMNEGLTIDAGGWFPKITHAIRHYDDSMKEYTRGSILALQELTDFSKIIWGQNYVIETEEMRVTKKIAKGENDFHLTGYSTCLLYTSPSPRDA